MKMINLKNKGLECLQHFTRYESMGIFPNAQGQLTSQSLIGFSRISNLPVIIWLSSLPAKIKKIRSKMKAVECSKLFLHYSPMGAICCHGKQSSNPI